RETLPLPPRKPDLAQRSEGTLRQACTVVNISSGICARPSRQRRMVGRRKRPGHGNDGSGLMGGPLRPRLVVARRPPRPFPYAPRGGAGRLCAHAQDRAGMACALAGGGESAVSLGGALHRVVFGGWGGRAWDVWDMLALGFSLGVTLLLVQIALNLVEAYE